MWSYAQFTVLAVASAAMVTDLAYGKIPNKLILYGACVAGILCLNGGPGLGGMIAKAASSAAGAAIPLLGGWFLFRFRMIGAGDVKLMAVMGALTGLDRILEFTAVALLSGALISLALMLTVTGVRGRLLYLRNYVLELAHGGEVGPYRGKTAFGAENIHFAVPVFMAAVLYASGLIV